MGRIADVQNAFRKRLSTLTSSPWTSTDVAYENVNYTPVQGTPWLRCTQLPGDSGQLHLDGTQSNPGLFQVDVYVELEKGTSDLMTIMDDIYDHFDGQTLTENSTLIFVGSISVTPAVREESWLRGSINIEYQSYAT